MIHGMKRIRGNGDICVYPSLAQTMRPSGVEHQARRGVRQMGKAEGLAGVSREEGMVLPLLWTVDHIKRGVKALI